MFVFCVLLVGCFFVCGYNVKIKWCRVCLLFDVYVVGFGVFGSFYG